MIQRVSSGPREVYRKRVWERHQKKERERVRVRVRVKNKQRVRNKKREQGR